MLIVQNFQQQEPCVCGCLCQGARCRTRRNEKKMLRRAKAKVKQRSQLSYALKSLPKSYKPRDGINLATNPTRAATKANDDLWSKVHTLLASIWSELRQFFNTSANRKSYNGKDTPRYDTFDVHFTESDTGETKHFHFKVSMF